MKLEYKELIKELIYVEEDYELIYSDVSMIVRSIGYSIKDFKEMLRSIRYDSCPDIIDENHENYEMLCTMCERFDIRW